MDRTRHTDVMVMTQMLHSSMVPDVVKLKLNHGGERPINICFQNKWCPRRGKDSRL